LNKGIIQSPHLQFIFQCCNNMLLLLCNFVNCFLHSRDQTISH
jgi:hypothetical protein